MTSRPTNRDKPRNTAGNICMTAETFSILQSIRENHPGSLHVEKIELNACPGSVQRHVPHTTEEGTRDVGLLLWSLVSQ